MNHKLKFKKMEENEVVGYNWNSEEKVVLTGSEFRAITNFVMNFQQFMNAYFEAFSNQSSQMFGDVATHCENIMKRMVEEGSAKPVTAKEFEEKKREFEESQQDSEDSEAPQQSN